jgi:response regulator RpfG family c-di-GMP phosphodiesterase
VGIGGAMVTPKVTKVATLVEQADHALYQAKAAGRNVHVWYTGYCQDGLGLGSSDHFACVRDRLRATLEKTRASALASFEAMVHSQTRDYLTLQARNKLALQMVNLLCKRLNLPRNVSQSFRRAFKLHDLLRLFISDSTLKKSGSLSEAEMLAIEDQPLMLKQLTDLFDFFADERMILRYHHEYFDGSGYPEGLDGQDIPMGARLFTVVDAYVAMMVPSYERPLKDKDEVVSEFERLSGVQFDPFIVSLLIDIVSKDSFVNIIKE